MKAFSPLLFAMLAWNSHAQADTIHTPPGVTMELCSELDIDEVQEAIAIEYQGEDDRETMVTVTCSGATATVRVIGPSHPRGRIVDVDLSGVDSIAMPRTIALLAAELWTAPEPAETESAGGAAPTGLTRDSDVKLQGPSYRDTVQVGLGLRSTSRTLYAGRSAGQSKARGTLVAASLHVEFPLWSWFGLYGYQLLSGYHQLDGHSLDGDGIQWRRGEIGAYIPVRKSRLRMDVTGSVGFDYYSAVGETSSSMDVMPDYLFDTLGVDFAYPVNPKLLITGAANVMFITNRGLDAGNLSGLRWGMGLTYELQRRVQIRGEVEALWANGGSSYADTMTSFELGARYLY